jgi:fatty acid desaturase
LNSPNDRRAWACVDAVLLVAAIGSMLFQFFVAPLFLPLGTFAAVSVVCLAAVSAPLQWGLMHETIHGTLYRSATLNRRVGRLLGDLLSLSWEVMRFGHLTHHSSNRHDLDRPEMVPPGGSQLAAAPSYFFKLLGGHELIYVLAPVGLALPSPWTTRLIRTLASGADMAQMRTVALRVFANPLRRSRIRVDLLMTIAILSLAFWCWGKYWPVLAGCLGVRFCVLSLLDNAPHYATPVDSGTSARNTHMPRWAAWLVLNQNFHSVHHKSPRLKWHELPMAFARSGQGLEGSWAGAVLRQFHGPIVLR